MGMICIRHIYSNQYFENKIAINENYVKNDNTPVYDRKYKADHDNSNERIPYIINNKKYFSKRNELMEYACRFARKVYGESLEYTHEERVGLQHRITSYSEAPDDDCVPDLPMNGPRDVHFYLYY